MNSPLKGKRAKKKERGKDTSTAVGERGCPYRFVYDY
jgi:hypothetical protein